MKFLNIAGRASASAVAGVLCTALSTTLLPAAQAAEPIPPLEPVADVDAAKVELGKKLYFDPRLSKSGFISCNSCHNLSMGGTDNLQDLDRPQLAAGPDQLADGAELQPQRRTVLGRPRRGPQGAGRRPDRQPRRDGLHA
jgi:cytochrome c peroxidase